MTVKTKIQPIHDALMNIQHDIGENDGLNKVVYEKGYVKTKAGIVSVYSKYNVTLGVFESNGYTELSYVHEGLEFTRRFDVGCRNHDQLALMAMNFPSERLLHEDSTSITTPIKALRQVVSDLYSSTDIDEEGNYVPTPDVDSIDSEERLLELICEYHDSKEMF